jgi:hypothetical protein
MMSPEGFTLAFYGVQPYAEVVLLVIYRDASAQAFVGINNVNGPFRLSEQN